MTNPSKKRQILTTSQEQQLFTSNTPSEPDIGDKSQESSIELFRSIVTDLYSGTKGNEKPFKLWTNDTQQNNGITTSSSLPQLPNEIIALILNHVSTQHRKQQQQKTLHACTVVSKLFYAIANPLLWQDLDFIDNIDPQRFITVAKSIIPRFSTLTQHIWKLHLDGLYWTDDLVKHLVPHIPNLKHLVIWHQDPPLAEMFLKPSASFLTYRSFYAIGQHCHQLAHLEWKIALNQWPSWLRYLLPRCPLKTLKINFALPLIAYDILVIKEFHHLTSLVVDIYLHNHQQLLLPSPPTTTSDMKYSWLQLTNLELGRCDDLDDTTFIGFIKTHPQLEHLRLQKADQLTDKSLDAMTEYLPGLKRLDLKHNKNLTTAGVQRLILGCPGLVGLWLWDCPQVSKKHLHGLDLMYCDGWVGILFTQMDINMIKRKGRQ